MSLWLLYLPECDLLHSRHRGADKGGAPVLEELEELGELGQLEELEELGELCW